MSSFDDAELADFITLGAKALGVSLPPAIFAGVNAQAAILFDHAARVLAFNIPAETDPAIDF